MGLIVLVNTRTMVCDSPSARSALARDARFIGKYSAHWILRLASVKGVEVAIDSAVAISRVFNYKMVNFYK